MNRSLAALFIAVLCATLIGTSAAPVAAATLNVPGTYATIQDAINAAIPNDTVLVADGDYNENIDINVARLTLLSVNGPGSTSIFSNAVDTPVVTISANGVTVGGPGQGFAIRQLDPGPAAVPHAGNAGVRVLGDQVHLGTVTVQNNTILGLDADEGVLINPAIDRGHLIIRENVFGRTPAATFGFQDAIHFHFTDFGGEVGQACLLNAEVELLDNTIRRFNRAGVYFHDDVFKSNVRITSPEVRAANNSAYGLYFFDGIRNSSLIDIENTNIHDVDTGVYVSGDIDAASTLDILGCNIDQFASYGVYISGYVEGSSTLRINPTTMAGDGSATAGVYLNNGLEYGGNLIVENCSISGVVDYGIYFDDLYAGCVATLTGNTIAGPNAGLNYGIYMGYGPNYGSDCTANNNTITKIYGYGVYVYETYYGGHLTLNGNTISAVDAGMTYGLYFDDIYDYSSVTANGNTIAGFNDYGVYSDEVYDDSQLTMNNNNLTAHKDGCNYGIYAYDQYNGATCTFEGNTVTGFGNLGTEYGFYNDNVEDESTLILKNNTFTAHENGADYGFYTSSGWEYGSTGEITNNTFTGFDMYGFYNGDYVTENSSLTIRQNRFTSHENGADYGIWAFSSCYEGGTTMVNGNTVIGYTDTGIGGDDAYDSGHVTCNNNVVTAHKDGADYGIYFDDIYGGADCTINGNNVSGFGGMGGGEYGLYLYSVYEGSRSTINDNTFTAHADGSEYCFYTSSGWYYGSKGIFKNNTCTGFNYAGFFNDSYVTEGSELTVADCQFDAHEDGATYGIYNDEVEYGAMAYFTGNNITGIRNDGGDAYGMWFYDSWYGSWMEVNNNTVRPHAGGASYGIYFDYPSGDGAYLGIAGNNVRGFTEASLYISDYSDGGAVLDIADNEFGGNRYGMYFSGYLGDGAAVSIYNNLIENFKMVGIYFHDTIWGSDMSVDANRILGDGADQGIMHENIEAASKVQVLNNCFKGVQEALQVTDITQTSRLIAHQNDFSGAVMGINNVSGNAEHKVDGADNYWGAPGAPMSGVNYDGQVRVNPYLSGAPDEDGDGVGLCADKCSGTEAGQSADADGCSCQQLDNCADQNGPVQPACCGAAGVALPVFMAGYALLLVMRRKRRT